MLVDNQLIKVSWNWKSKEHWLSKGYFLPKMGVKFEVKAEDLQASSNVTVAIECDKCSAVRLGKAYRQNKLCRSCAKKGIKHSDEHKRRNSECKKKLYSEQGHHRTGYKYPTPQDHPSYNPDLSDADRADRRGNREYKQWSYDVKMAGNFACQVCGDDKGGNLVSHHIEAHNSNVELRYNVSNGVCLCDTCHKDFHFHFGYGNNTSEQFEQYTVEKDK